MSTTVTSFEELRIKDSPKGAELVRKLSDYIRQFNEMKDLEDLVVAYLELVCGDERAAVEDQTEVEPGNAWVITQNGFERKSAEHMIWEPDSTLMKLVKNLNPGREIVFRLTGSMTRPGNDGDGPFRSKSLFTDALFCRWDYQRNVRYFTCLTEETPAAFKHIHDSEEPLYG